MFNSFSFRYPTPAKHTDKNMIVIISQVLYFSWLLIGFIILREFSSQEQSKYQLQPLILLLFLLLGWLFIWSILADNLAFIICWTALSYSCLSQFNGAFSLNTLTILSAVSLIGVILFNNKIVANGLLLFGFFYLSFWGAINIDLLTNITPKITTKILLWQTTPVLLTSGFMLVGYINFLKNQLIQFKRISFYDELTSLFNRRYFQKKLVDLSNEEKRHQTYYCLLLLDIDFFKKINDKFGHITGDQALIHISDCLRKSVREGDIVTRWGGEEFAIILPHTNTEGALKLAERCRYSIESQPLLINEKETIEITASFGVSNSKDHLNIEQLLKAADEALFSAKISGRNKVVMNY
ncbi:MAG: GGDEF domain-containing protein [Oleispira sp.]